MLNLFHSLSHSLSLSLFNSLCSEREVYVKDPSWIFPRRYYLHFQFAINSVINTFRNATSSCCPRGGGGGGEGDWEKGWLDSRHALHFKSWQLSAEKCVKCQSIFKVDILYKGWRLLLTAFVCFGMFWCAKLNLIFFIHTRISILFIWKLQ